MTNLLRILLTFAILGGSSSVDLVAQSSADLWIFLHVKPTATPGTLEWQATVQNLGPDAAENVELSTHIDEDGPSCKETLPELSSGATHTLDCEAFLEAPPSDSAVHHLVFATVQSTTPDPDPSNNQVRRNVAVVTNPDLVVLVHTEIADPGLPFEIELVIGNRGTSEARGVEVVVELPDADGFVDVPESCSTVGKTIRCEVGSVPAKADPFAFSALRLTLNVLAPEDPSGATLPGTVEIRGDQPDHDESSNEASFEVRMFRTAWVTSDADAGPGTLRAAIEEVNSGCPPEDLCKIAFRIPPAADHPWETISVRAPLPHVTAQYVRIDGTTQTRFFGDTNPFGPEVELHGSRVESTSEGLVLSGRCNVDLSGLTINGFRGSGVLVAGQFDCPNQQGAWWLEFSIRECYIGTDPTGMIAIPNERGVVVAFDSNGRPWDVSGNLPALVDITGNIISGNRRSGIYSIRGTRLISRNIIGLNRALTASLGNGASGVYIGPESHGTDIENNYIGFNTHFGIAVDVGAEFVAMRSNSIQANLQRGIDIGLDGVTNGIQVPSITLATWDPENQVTIIEGLLPHPNPAQSLFGYPISVYANDAPDPSGFGEGQYFLGEANADRYDGHFRFTYAADLRGKWISATATDVTHFTFAKPVTGSGENDWIKTTTGEFGQSVEVH